MNVWNVVSKALAFSLMSTWCQVGEPLWLKELQLGVVDFDAPNLPHKDTKRRQALTSQTLLKTSPSSIIDAPGRAQAPLCLLVTPKVQELSAATTLSTHQITR
ncbi:hypothetical protein BCR37DRAFT_379920 [Protomyces lactucae-debilis]|uniref:Secreted protein n=1 Tax=Protomyces lactucae-debilis TaxID=2754530 RepID=A0A1Y2FDK2_PROLT|nr:uncharacterized protein BCR37DRAFT_379920 [Protomyces lactucae-debilis]ORY82003.1 hypothetical protein BCR37DRAFT_379920 [Protomyces lactucae-debilis]